MKDWNERLDALDAELDAWNSAYGDCFDRLLRRRRGLLGSLRRPSTGELEAVAREAQADVGDGPHAAVSTFLDDLAGYFLGASISERTKIRARVGASRALPQALWSFAHGSPDVIRGDGAADRLRVALAAIAIDDLRVDVESVWEVLGRLWLAAHEAGVDPQPIFAEVAEVANRGAGGGGAHLREVLRDFDRSPWFAQHVEPELSPRRRAG